MNVALSVKAHAKLNLGLRVLGLRTDGFHELHTHMQTISLADELRFELTGRKDIAVQMTPPLDIPAPENLVFRAIELFRQRTGTEQGLRCEVIKKIPIAAGLGGGSSDAAATLLALNRLFQAQLAQESLMEMGAKLGSDVPFFLHGGFACARGRGEIIQPLPETYQGYFVVLVPPLFVSTPEVFKAWDALQPKSPPKITNGCAVLDSSNDLELPACRRYPELQPYAELIRQAPTPLKGMSGSGSAWFAGFDVDEEAVEFQRYLRVQNSTLHAFIVKAIPGFDQQHEHTLRYSRIR